MSFFIRFLTRVWQWTVGTIIGIVLIPAQGAGEPAPSSYVLYSCGDGVILLHDPQNPDSDAVNFNDLVTASVSSQVCVISVLDSQSSDIVLSQKYICFELLRGFIYSKLYCQSQSVNQLSSQSAS